MVIFERTEKQPYDGIQLQITGGYETRLDEYFHYFVTWLETLGFARESVIDGLKEWIEEWE